MHSKERISRIILFVSLLFALAIAIFVIRVYHDKNTGNSLNPDTGNTAVLSTTDIPTLTNISGEQNDKGTSDQRTGDNQADVQNDNSIKEQSVDDGIVSDEGSELSSLIQTVSDSELYRGFISYGDFTVHALTSADTSQAYSSVRPCIVRIDMNGANGSGIVWKMEQDRIVIVTNRHVLQYWDDQAGTVSFVDGTVTNAKLIGMSGKHDVGFLQIPSGWLDYSSLRDIRQASYSMDAYNNAYNGEDEFGVGSASGIAADFYPGYIDSLDTYMTEFGENMIYCDSNAIHGMSGGGTFDGCGNLIGMITGGSDYNISVSVPLPSIIEAYNTLVNR